MSHDRLGLPMEALLDPCRRLIQEACCGGMVFISDALSEGPSSTDQGEVIPETRGCRSLPLRHLGSLQCSRIKHVFWNELRHHCFRCGHDQKVSFIFVSLVPFLSFWSCPLQIRLSCLAMRNSTRSDMTFSLHGPK